MNTIKITDELKARIRDHEGCVDTVYLDTLGKATIGIGHLVQPHERQRFKEGVKISNLILNSENNLWKKEYLLEIPTSPKEPKTSSPFVAILFIFSFTINR